MRLDDFKRQHDIRQRPSPRQQGRVLERHADEFQRSDDRFAGHGDGSAVRQNQSGHQFHQGGLAAAGGTHDRDQFAGLDVEIEAVDSNGLVAPAERQADIAHLNKICRRPHQRSCLEKLDRVMRL